MVAQLGEDGNQVLPSDGTRSRNDVAVEATSPGLGACASTLECCVENALVQRSIRFTDLAVLFEVDEVADSIPHLSFALFNKECLTHSHKGGASLATDGVDVAGDEGIVCGGDDGRVHNLTPLWFNLNSCAKLGLNS